MPEQQPMTPEEAALMIARKERELREQQERNLRESLEATARRMGGTADITFTGVPNIPDSDRAAEILASLEQRFGKRAK